MNLKKIHKIEEMFKKYFQKNHQKAGSIDPLILRARARSLDINVTLLQCWAQWYASSNRPVIKSYEAYCKASKAYYFHLISSFSLMDLLPISLTNLRNGNFGITRPYFCCRFFIVILIGWLRIFSSPWILREEGFLEGFLLFRLRSDLRWGFETDFCKVLTGIYRP